MDEVTRKYLASIASKGGKTTGASKRRGGKAYYQKIARLRKKRSTANEKADARRVERK